jgi:hypothetical protein
MCEENITVPTKKDMNEEVKIYLLDMFNHETRIQQNMFKVLNLTRKKMSELRYDSYLSETDLTVINHSIGTIHNATKSQMSQLTRIANIVNGVSNSEDDPLIQRIKSKREKYLESRRIQMQIDKEDKMAKLKADLEQLETELAKLTKASAWNNKKQIIQNTEINEEEDCDFQSETDDVETEEEYPIGHSIDIAHNPTRLQHDDDDLPPAKKRRQSKNN